MKVALGQVREVRRSFLADYLLVPGHRAPGHCHRAAFEEEELSKISGTEIGEGMRGLDGHGHRVRRAEEVKAAAQVVTFAFTEAQEFVFSLDHRDQLETEIVTVLQGLDGGRIPFEDVRKHLLDELELEGRRRNVRLSSAGLAQTLEGLGRNRGNEGPQHEENHESV
jgi:hypothetical protein